MKAPFLPLIALGLFGCGGYDPKQACLDAADALGRAVEACGASYQDAVDSFANAAGGPTGCAAIKTVRDGESFYNECIPFLRALSCQQLTDSNFMTPATCQGQLGR